MLKPRNDYIVVKRDKPETVSAGGIALVLAVDASQEPAQGEVIAAGPGKRNKAGELEPLAVKVGDRILFEHYAGTTLKVDGQEVLMMKEDEIFAVLDGRT